MCSPANRFGPRWLRPLNDTPRDTNVRDPVCGRDPNDRGAGRSYKSATTVGFRNDFVSDPDDRDDVVRPKDEPVDDRRGRSE